MPQQAGLIKLKGKMSGITFYKMGDMYYAKTASGPGKEKILHDPAFVRTRENNSEFSGCAKVACAFRQTFSQVKNVSDGFISSRLTGLFKSINSKSDGVRGKRPISLSQHRERLAGFAFNKKAGVHNFFTGLLSVIHSSQRTDASITIEPVVLNNVLKAPAGATHVMFTQVLGVISDYSYNENLECYAPLDPAMNTTLRIINSDYISLQTKDVFSVKLETHLPTETEMPSYVSVVQCFCISFFQKTENDFELVPNGRVMNVLSVF
jgi:hypothetical protein